MTSGFNDQANFMQFSKLFPHDLGKLRGIHFDYKLLKPNSFNRPTMLLLDRQTTLNASEYGRTVRVVTLMVIKGGVLTGPLTPF